jgi:hypothetical protein
MTNQLLEGIVLGSFRAREIAHGKSSIIGTCDSFPPENDELIKEDPVGLKFHCERCPYTCYRVSRHSN